MPPDTRAGPVRRAWLVLLLLPVSWLLAFAVGEGLIGAFGYNVGGSYPTWLAVLTDVVACVVAVAPCLVGGLLAWRGCRTHQPHALPPLVVSTVLGTALVALTLVSLIGDLVR